MKKKIKVIFIVLILVNVILLVFLINYRIRTKRDNNTLNATDYQIITDDTYTGSIEINQKIFPENHYQFEKLYTEPTQYKKFYSELYSFIKYMPKLYEKTKNYTSNELEKFYGENKSILRRYHIYDKDDFASIMKQYRKVFENNNSGYKNVKILVDTFKKKNDGINCDFEIEYENNIIIKFRLDLKEDESGNLTIYFRSIDDEV